MNWIVKPLPGQDWRANTNSNTGPKPVLVLALPFPPGLVSVLVLIGPALPGVTAGDQFFEISFRSVLTPCFCLK